MRRPLDRGRRRHSPTQGCRRTLSAPAHGTFARCPSNARRISRDLTRAPRNTRDTRSRSPSRRRSTAVVVRSLEHSCRSSRRQPAESRSFRRRATVRQGAHHCCRFALTTTRPAIASLCALRAPMPHIRQPAATHCRARPSPGGAAHRALSRSTRRRRCCTPRGKPTA